MQAFCSRIQIPTDTWGIIDTREQQSMAHTYCCSSDSCEEAIHRRDKIPCVHTRDKNLCVTSELLLYLQGQLIILVPMQNDKQNKTGKSCLGYIPREEQAEACSVVEEGCSSRGAVNLVTQGDAIHLHIEGGLCASGPWQGTPVNICSWELPLLQGKEQGESSAILVSSFFGCTLLLLSLAACTTGAGH